MVGPDPTTQTLRQAPHAAYRSEHNDKESHKLTIAQLAPTPRFLSICHSTNPHLYLSMVGLDPATKALARNI
jgi:hypothetical protein